MSADKGNGVRKGAREEKMKGGIKHGREKGREEGKEGLREVDGDNEVKSAPTLITTPISIPTTSQHQMTAHSCVLRTLASLLASSSCSGLII